MNAKNVLSSPLRYLDKALNGLRDLGLMPRKPDEMPVITLINQISDLDEEKTIARLELTRDEQLRDLQAEDRRYQIAKDLAENLSVSYNTTEVVMARLVQTTDVKERVYSQAVSFFGTNETVFTALNASFTSLQGLHESTRTLEAMKEGINESLETLAEVGDKVQEDALRAGYGPTIKADSVKKLLDSVINFQEKSRSLIVEMRELSTRNEQEISRAVEDGKRRMVQLTKTGKLLTNE